MSRNMLSKITTKLPGLSHFMGPAQYQQSDVEEAITKIKALGKRSSTVGDEDSMKDIEQILSLMKKYSDSLQVQRVSAHALSNLAMQVVAARWIVQKNGFGLIKKAIVKFHGDHKLCWLSSSAIWNLARPPANRAIIGREGAQIMLQILYEHRNREKVSNTAIGALSNLSLQESLKDLIAQQHNLDLILAVLTQNLNKRSLPVMTSGAGLLANIAVSDTHAAQLVSKKALNVLMPLLDWDFQTPKGKAPVQVDETLYRNTCAALNNLVSADGFLEAFLKARGLETVLSFLKNNDNEMYGGLLENCLATIDADNDVDTTSFHYACFHGKLDVLRHLHVEYPHFDLDSQDERHMTLLDYAISQNHNDLVQFLCKLGATQHTRENDDVSEQISESMSKGTKTLKMVVQTNQSAIEEALPYFPTDLCKFMTEFTSNTDMLSGMGHF